MIQAGSIIFDFRVRAHTYMCLMDTSWSVCRKLKIIAPIRYTS